MCLREFGKYLHCRVRCGAATTPDLDSLIMEREQSQLRRYWESLGTPQDPHRLLPLSAIAQYSLLQITPASVIL